MANKSNNSEFNPYMREINNKSNWQNFLLALYNPQEKTVLGRSGKGWGLLMIFYAVFYAVLAALFAICMYTMLKLIPPDRPMYTLSSSLIGVNPGMGFRPQFVDQASLIWYDAANKTQVDRYVNDINDFLQPYTNLSYPNAGSRVLCSFGGSKQDREACIVNVSPAAFGKCTPENEYGYKHSKPCIFLKINKIFDWVPDCYTEPDPSMPKDLQDYITSLEPKEREQIWISCAGEDPGDNETLSGGIEYFPSRGIPNYYYPYRKQLGYVSPTIAVQFTNPELKRIINIRCRAWAKNIVYSHSMRELYGSTHIELMID